MTIKVELFPGKHYQYLYVDNSYIASFWGEVTEVEEGANNKYFIRIGVDCFIHDVDTITYRTKDTELKDAIKQLTGVC